jgi:hypothetical protein
MVGLGGIGDKFNVEVVYSFHMRDLGNIPRNTPSSPPIKGGPLPFIHNNTQDHKSFTKQEQEHLHSMGLGPS